jgi:HD-like signal output (HDOD) protein
MQGSVAAPISAEAEALLGEVKECFGKPSYRPPLLPDVALKVQDLARDPNVDMLQIVATLQEDNLLSATVLRRAQSAWFSGRGKIVSLKDAILRIGTKGLRDLVWEVAFQSRVLASKAFTTELNQLRKHSLFTAYVARLVATKTNVPSDHAFLSGLVHDIGIAAMLVVIAQNKLAAKADVSHVMEVVRAGHQETSGLIARLWKLPRELENVLARHHDRDLLGTPDPLLSVLIIAEHFAHALSADGPGQTDKPVGDSQIAQASSVLGLSRTQREALQAEASLLVKPNGALGSAE